MTNGTPPFEPLSRLFRGDPGRVRRVLEIFERTTRKDLEQLDAAYASRDWATIGQLAHKMKAGCLQLGEASAATGLATLERMIPSTAGGDAIVKEFTTTRSELDGVITRVTRYLASGNEVADE